MFNSGAGGLFWEVLRGRLPEAYLKLPRPAHSPSDVVKNGVGPFAGRTDYEQTKSAPGECPGSGWA